MKSFTGKSANGNIQEALDDAIENAKQGLPSDFVEWKLESINGQDGGIVQIHELTVTISVKTT